MFASKYKSRLVFATMICLCVTVFTSRASAQVVSLLAGTNASINKPEVEKAYAGGLEILIRGAENYPRHRDCFSCHHQAMSVFALSTSVRALTSQLEVAKLPERQDTLLRDVREFTLSSFESMKPDLVAGKKIGGRTLTVGYALWTLDLTGHEPDSLSDAFVENLLLTQEEDGHWGIDSVRPPASSSVQMATAFALMGLDLYGGPPRQNPRIAKAIRAAADWLRKQPPSTATEDIVGALWCNYLLKPHVAHESKELQQLIQMQRADGGWAQEPGLESDAYATGQVLILWTQVNKRYAKVPPVHTDQRFRKGIRFLLDQQKPDGSWHVATRARPVQEYFDNEDPHGKDQFISYMATGWATAAIGSYLYRDVRQGPLDPHRKMLASRQRNSADESSDSLFGTEPLASEPNSEFPGMLDAAAIDNAANGRGGQKLPGDSNK